jgi:type II secretory pathway component GspD/PulD (secretin)
LFAFQAVTPFEQIDREVIVVPEVISNSLIVSATPRYYDAVRQIIRDLDYKPPMVLVQVVLASVRLDDAFEFGVELGLQDSLLFDRGRENPEPNGIGFNFNNPQLGLGNDNTAASNATRELLAGQALSNFLLGRTSGTLNYGGLVLSAANESVNILVRALQDQGRLQVLARPQVMTLDNEEAFVQIGQRVPRITGSSITPQGGTQSTVVDEPVGLLLRIRPRVNQEDVVVMTVDTERSEVNFNEGVPVSVDQFGNQVISPLIETITAQTTLSARSGQTIVFAGLIAKRRRVETRRVPYLSDVPILGHLFRFDQDTTNREELLIFLTPHIVRSDEDIERLKYIESDRMSWCLADLVEMHGPAGLSGGHGLWNPPPTPTIYPHEDPAALGAIPVTPGTAGELELVPTPARGQPPAATLPPPIPGSGPVEPRLNEPLPPNSASAPPTRSLMIQPANRANVSRSPQVPAKGAPSGQNVAPASYYGPAPARLPAAP